MIFNQDFRSFFSFGLIPSSLGSRGCIGGVALNFCCKTAQGKGYTSETNTHFHPKGSNAIDAHSTPEHTLPKVISFIKIQSL